MSSNTLIPHTNAHAVCAGPTLKDAERFRNGSVRELKEKKQSKLKRHSMISNGLNEQPECEKTTDRMDKSLSTGICKNVNIVRICTADDQCKNSDVYVELMLPVTMFCLLKGTDFQQRKMKSNSSTFVPLVVNIMIFLIVLKFFSKVTAEIVVYCALS